MRNLLAALEIIPTGTRHLRSQAAMSSDEGNDPVAPHKKKGPTLTPCSLHTLHEPTSERQHAIAQPSTAYCARRARGHCIIPAKASANHLCSRSVFVSRHQCPVGGHSPLTPLPMGVAVPVLSPSPLGSSGCHSCPTTALPPLIDFGVPRT
jgi:hypothetical protein